MSSLQETRQRRQVYGIPTFDALFQSLVNHQHIRDAFLQDFIPDIPFVSSQRLDALINPVAGIQYVHAHFDDFGVMPPPSFKSLAESFHARTTKLAFPRRHRYYGTTDFVCQRENGDNILVELSPVIHSFWDRRALACVVAFSGYQAAHNIPWNPIHKVIGIHILGNIREKTLWACAETNLLRGVSAHPYRKTPILCIGNVELEGYSIQDFPRQSLSREQKEWITFFQRGAYMDEERVTEKIQTPAVIHAFKLARVDTFSKDIRELYEEQDHEYDKYSEHTRDRVRRGQEEVLIDLVKNWHKKGKSVTEIADLLEKDEVWVNSALSTPEEKDDAEPERA